MAHFAVSWTYPIVLALVQASETQVASPRLGASESARAALAQRGAAVTIGAWLDDAPLPFDPRARLRERLAGVGARDVAGVDAASAAQAAELASAMRARVTGPFAAAARAAGLEVVHEGALVPVVYVRGAAEAVSAFLAARADARFVDVDRPALPELDVSVKTTRADRLWS